MTDFPELTDIQKELVKLWKDTYSDEFRKSEVIHKDFTHALLHVVKSTGKLSAMAEAADHHPEARAFLFSDAPRCLADVVICVLRMANTLPGGEINLHEAIMKRLKDKMGYTD